MNFPALPQFRLSYLLILAWSLLWKGLALWRAAKEEKKTWFIAMLILNTAGLLEIAFLLFFADQQLTFQKLKNKLIQEK